MANSFDTQSDTFWAAVLSVVLVGLCVYASIDSYLFMNRSVVTEAIVIDPGERRKDRKQTYRPKYKIETPDGPVEAKAKHRSRKFKVAAGDRVQVRYDSKDPTRVVPADAHNPWSRPLSFLALAIGSGGWAGYRFLRPSDGEKT